MESLEGRCATSGHTQYGARPAVSSSQYAIDAANEQTNWGTANMTYDANGNLTADGVNKYNWDARNQLTSMTTSSGSPLGSFGYDALGRRYTKTVGGTTTAFLYDGVNSVQELAGTTPTANLLSGGIDEVFTRTDSAGTRNFLTDALGSTVALADPTGVLQTQYTYDPFGASSFSGSASGNSFQFTGRENDGTGLYYYRARYSNPTTTRFISEDPIGIQGGIDLYTFAANMPTNFGDPTGLLPSEGHYGLTYSLAKQIFGSACEARAQAVAHADADQDSLFGLGAHIEFYMGRGDAWKEVFILVARSTSYCRMRWPLAMTRPWARLCMACRTICLTLALMRTRAFTIGPLRSH